MNKSGGMSPCYGDFHLDECNLCGLSREDRDEPMNATNAAMNFGDGYAEALTAVRLGVEGMEFEFDDARPFHFMVERNGVLRLLDKARRRE